MTFEKNNKYRYQAEDPLNESPLCIRLPSGLKEEIRKIPKWQDKIRMLLQDWVEEQNH